MYTEDAQKFLDDNLPNDYRKKVGKKLKGKYNPATISHVRGMRRWNDDVAVAIMEVAREEHARKEAVKAKLAV